jgi:hypothetical protein
MHRLISGGFVAVTCILLAPACDLGDVCGCTPAIPEISGMIFGTVFAPDSTPIAAATVAVTGGLDSCVVDGEIFGIDGASDTAGAYTAYFEADDLDDESVCVVAQAIPPAGSGFAASDPLTLGYDDEHYNQHIVEEHDFYLKP